MRELKFRAWHEENKSFVFETISGIWKNGWLCHSHIPEADKLPDKAVETAFVPNAQWEQFTGLKDKNGIEIYEGDICRSTDSEVDGIIISHNGSFTWTDGACFWYLVISAKDGEIRNEVVFETDDLVIIGNIHQNPELLSDRGQNND